MQWNLTAKTMSLNSCVFSVSYFNKMQKSYRQFQASPFIHFLILRNIIWRIWQRRKPYTSLWILGKTVPRYSPLLPVITSHFHAKYKILQTNSIQPFYPILDTESEFHWRNLAKAKKWWSCKENKYRKDPGLPSEVKNWPTFKKYL